MIESHTRVLPRRGHSAAPKRLVFRILSSSCQKEGQVLHRRYLHHRDVKTAQNVKSAETIPSYALQGTKVILNLGRLELHQETLAKIEHSSSKKTKVLHISKAMSY